MINTHNTAAPAGHIATRRELQTLSGNDAAALQDSVELNTRTASEGTVGMAVGRQPATTAGRAAKAAFGRTDTAQATGIGIGLTLTAIGTVAVALYEALRRK